MFSNLSCCWHPRVFYSLWPFSFTTFSFEFHMRVIRDVSTMIRYSGLSLLFLILVERTQTIIMNLEGPFMDLVCPFIDIADVKRWSYGYVDMFTPCRVKPEPGTFTSKRYRL